MSDSYSETIDSLRDYRGEDTAVAEMIRRVVPVSGVSIMTLGRVLPAGTVTATGPVAARLDELQLDLGEGPAWDALRGSQPVLEPNVRAHPVGAWPAFSEAIAGEEVGAMFAFGLRVGPLDVGALMLYSRTPMQLAREQVAQVVLLADLVARYILRHALEDVGNDPTRDPPNDPFSRRPIHQATGMVIAQLGTSAENAELIIRGHAFAHDIPLRLVAEEILQRRLTFAAPNTGTADRPQRSARRYVVTAFW